jgi:quinol monooxygenase YgiN
VFARSTTVKGQSDAIDRGIAQVRDEVLPTVGGMDGCLGLSMLVDRSSGECIVTTSWESEAAMRATAEQVKPLRERATALLGGLSSVQEWEIAVMHRDHRSGEGSCVRSTWMSMDPANVERGLDFYRLGLIPRLEELEGFCSACLLIDRSTGMAVSTVAFDSRAAMESTRATGEELRRSSAAELGLQILDVHEYELALAHLHVPEMV